MVSTSGTTLPETRVPTGRPARWRNPRSSTDPRIRLLGRLVSLVDKPTDADERKLANALLVGDPKADAVADWMMGQAGTKGRRLFELALEKGIEAVSDAPDCLRVLFAEIDARPAWVDEPRLRLAATAAHRVGYAGQIVLSGVCLMGGYRSSAANKPIAMTGALRTGAYRRLAETSKFTVDLYEVPELTRFSSGFKGAVRVRLMHALVRRRLQRSPAWREDEWGVPINQTDMLATNLLFSVLTNVGLRCLGFVFSARETDATLHFWRYVGVLMGIDDDLLPKTYREGLKWLYLIGATQPGADDDSRALAKALIDIPLHETSGVRRILGHAEVRLRSGFSRLVLGNQSANELELANDPLQYASLLVAPLVVCAECLRLVTPGGTRLAAKLGRAVVQRNVRTILEGRQPTYVP